MKHHFTKNVENELKKDLTGIRTCDLLITRPRFYHRAMLDFLQNHQFFYNMLQKKESKIREPAKKCQIPPSIWTTWANLSYIALSNLKLYLYDRVS